MHGFHNKKPLKRMHGAEKIVDDMFDWITKKNDHLKKECILWGIIVIFWNVKGRQLSLK